MRKVVVQIDESSKEITSGLILVKELYLVVGCSKGQKLFLNCEGGIDIPLLETDYLWVHGGEKLFIGTSSLEDNPPLRKGIQINFNGNSIRLDFSKITGKELKEKDDKFPQGRLFADIAESIDQEIKDDMRIVIQSKDSYIVIPPAAFDGNDGSIDLEECGKYQRKPIKIRKYKIKIDGEKYIVDKPKINGVEILKLASKTIDEWSLNQKMYGGKRIKVDSKTVDLTLCGIERFETVRRQAQQGHV